MLPFPLALLVVAVVADFVVVAAVETVVTEVMGVGYRVGVTVILDVDCEVVAFVVDCVVCVIV